MKHIFTMMIVVASAIMTSGCGGHTSTPPIEQPTHETVYSSFDGMDRIYGAPGLADPGTDAEVVDYGARTVVRADGSFTIDFSRNASQRKSSLSLIPPLFVVTYYSGGKLVEELIFEADYSLESSVSPQLFGTGSGPNDMLYGNDSLYIANSMDNTVTRHSLAGELLATGQFDEFSSPSYLGYFEHGLLVTCNGNSKFAVRDSSDLTEWLSFYNPPVEDFVFPGPGQPIYTRENIFIPWTNIEDFSPTIYAEVAVTVIPGLNTDFPSFSDPITNLTPIGKNSQFANVDSLGNYYVVSTGEIQFDEFWSPYADSDSYLSLYEQGHYNGNGNALNLGPIGAGRIAISPDGSTAFLGNSLSGNLYMVDLINMEVLRGEDNPIVLTTEYTFISDVAFTPDGKYVLATSFNTDELYVVDALIGEVNPGPYPAPFDLSLDPELMAGAANVEIAPDASRQDKFIAYVMFGVANTVSKVDLY